MAHNNLKVTFSEVKAKVSNKTKNFIMIGNNNGSLYSQKLEMELIKESNCTYYVRENHKPFDHYVILRSGYVDGITDKKNQN